MYFFTNALLALKPPVASTVARQRNSTSSPDLSADDARDATLFNDQSLRFDAVPVASTESLEAFFQLGEGASADVFFVNRCQRNFAGLIEPDSPGRTVVDFYAAR